MAYSLGFRSTCHRVYYTVWHTEHPAPVVAPRRCSLLMAAAAGVDPFHIPCIACFDFREARNAYYVHYGQEIYRRLLFLLPNIPECCAGEVIDHFLDILRTANDHHRCPDIRPTFHRVEIFVRPPDDYSISAAFRDSLEAAGPRGRPATKASVSRLVEPDAVEGDQCVICMEKMETKSALMMPCQHVFHNACLVQWLDVDHVCPLCRYKMPVSDD